MMPSTNTSANAERGVFISLDGIDGAGKTTHLQAIQAWMTQQNLPFVMTREPGGTPLGESLRALLLDHGDGKARLRHGDGQRQAGRACANDENVAVLHGAYGTAGPAQGYSVSKSPVSLLLRLVVLQHCLRLRA
mgnify:CR=1 FL=1